MGIKYYVKYNDKSHILSDFDPFVEEISEYNYLVRKIRRPVIEKIVVSTDFYLCDRVDYKGRTYGKHILLKNIKLK